MYVRQTINEMTRRGFTLEQQRQFFEVYKTAGPSGFDVEMIDRFEYSLVNPVMSEIHQDMFKSVV